MRKTTTELQADRDHLQKIVRGSVFRPSEEIMVLVEEVLELRALVEEVSEYHLFYKDSMDLAPDSIQSQVKAAISSYAPKPLPTDFEPKFRIGQKVKVTHITTWEDEVKRILPPENKGGNCRYHLRSHDRDWIFPEHELEAVEE